MSYCKHDRKSWDCSLCKREEAVAFDATPVEKPTNGKFRHAPRIAPCPIPRYAVTEKYRDQLLVNWEYHPGVGYRLTFEDDKGIQTVRFLRKTDALGRPGKGKSNIHECPVPRALYDSKVADPDEWKLIHWNHSTAFRHFTLVFERKVGLHYERYQQVIGDRVVEHFTGDPYASPYDSELILNLMKDAFHREVSLHEGTSLINRWLKQKYGIFTELEGPPRRTGIHDQLAFPTKRGMKYTTERDFYIWLRQQAPIVNMDYSSVEKRIPKSLGIKEPKLVLNLTASPNMKGDTITITDNCTIMLGDKELRVRKEGDKLMLLDKEFKKLC